MTHRDMPPKRSPGASAAGVTKGSGNVFADLALPDPDLHLAKATLANTVHALLQDRGWTQAHASRLAGLSTSDMSDLCRGKLTKFSLERLEETLLRLGVDIEIRLHPHQNAERRGKRRVVL